MMSPDKIALQAIGSEIVKKTRVCEAPRFIATFSSLTGTEENPSHAALIRKGRLTNAIAAMIPP
jgi:hypothetical protein